MPGTPTHEDEVAAAVVAREWVDAAMRDVEAAASIPPSPRNATEAAMLRDPDKIALLRDLSRFGEVVELSFEGRSAKVRYAKQDEAEAAVSTLQRERRSVNMSPEETSPTSPVRSAPRSSQVAAGLPAARAASLIRSIEMDREEKAIETYREMEAEPRASRRASRAEGASPSAGGGARLTWR